MARKIIITIIAGSLYWLLTYVVMELFVLLKIQYSDIIGQVLYLVMPFLFGAVLLITIKEKNYVGIIYSAMIIAVRYMITFFEVTIRHSAGPSAFEQTFFLFRLMWPYSIVCGMLGGMLGVVLNKKVFTK